MPRKVNLVEEVIDVARRNGESDRRKYQARWKDDEELGTTMALSHYGTLIFAARLSGNRWRIVRLGGWSRSDADAIYTAMDKLNIPGWVSASQRNLDDADIPNLNDWALVDVPTWALREAMMDEL